MMVERQKQGRSGRVQPRAHTLKSKRETGRPLDEYIVLKTSKLSHMAYVPYQQCVFYYPPSWGQSVQMPETQAGHLTQAFTCTPLSHSLW